jgi:hypothetical protein
MEHRRQWKRPWRWKRKEQPEWTRLRKYEQQCPDGSRVLSFVGGKLLLEFGRLYKENYLDKGEMTPIFANAHDNTSYNLLMKQIKALGAKVGCRFEVQEIGSHQEDSSTMHDVLIIPHRI